MFWRAKTFGLRVLRYIIQWPLRLWRFILWALWIKAPRGKHSFYRWFCGLVLLSLDLTPVSVIYSTLMDIFKRRSRPLTDEEKKTGMSVFENSIPWALISLDPDSWLVRRKKMYAYVSFHTINFADKLPASPLIHELVHVWQYERYGSAYISEALWAQKWGGGYNYGGLEPLLTYSQGKRLAAFNFEQQADIIEDYFRWKTGLPLHWALNMPGIGEVLEKYKSDLMYSVKS